MVGVAIYIHDPEEWPDSLPLTVQDKRESALEAVKGWCEPVTKLVSLFPETLEKWALFDMFEYPLRNYNFDRIALAGDAAHASSPHHGAGASYGIVDDLCLCTLLDLARSAIATKGVEKNAALRYVFETYDEVRRGPTQWLVNSSRRICDLYEQPEWGDPVKRVKAETCFEEIKERSFKVWYFNSNEMVKQTIESYKKRLLGIGCVLDNNTTNKSSLSGGSQANGNPFSLKSNLPEIDWLVQIPDHAGMLQARLDNLESHMSNTKEQVARGKLIVAGPSLSAMDIWAPGNQRKMTGSVQIIRARNEDEVFRTLLQDPFAKQGVWNLQRVTLQPMRVGVAKA